ncbi:MAG: nitroreductase family protein [Rhodocyclaceae bacterium]|nr:nitroreductase family protein [Rhodocyclaceae bacterium]
MNRRKFIRIVGGGVVLAANAAALSGCAMFDVPPSAIAAWQGPPTDLELRRWILSYALLAPNPHNLQPWIADLATDREIVLKLDPQRLLPATDPYGRQILMGAGAFLELLEMAAVERGYRTEVLMFPDGEPGVKLDGRAFAKVRLTPDASAPRDTLFAQVLNRRTDRRAYDATRLIPPQQVERLRAAIGKLPVRFGFAGTAGSEAADVQRLAAIREIAREAWRIEMTTEATMMESMRVLRVGGTEINQHRDGIAITSKFLVLMAKFGMFDRSKFPAPDSQGTLAQIKDFNTITASTPAYLWLVTEGNSRAQQIDAGRAYVRVNLAGTAAGLAMHPNEQSLQEYSEVAKPYLAIHQLLDAPPARHTVQMLARVGYLPTGDLAAPPAPRRGLSAHLVA